MNINKKKQRKRGKGERRDIIGNKIEITEDERKKTENIE